MKKKILLIFLTLFFCGMLSAQTISGIINTYTEVTFIDDVNITVASTTGFSAGDRVLIIQMKGASVDETDSDLFGDILSYNSAGFYEFADVASISGSIITITFPLCHTFEIPGKVQLIQVPVYENVTISGEITASPWNGVTGGVVALEATGTVTLNADINVSGQGFRGGDRCNGFFTCGMDDYAVDFSSSSLGDCDAGKKGEAIAEVDEDISGGRGKLANGGGGSGTGQHGGSGGGNFGAGGRSAYEWTGCGVYDEIWAPGASSLDYSVDRIFMGGAGGGGQQDNGLSVTDGSNGGGIVIINATTIDALGYSIFADGNDVDVLTDSEGAGGAGAGGSVILRVDDFSSDLFVSVTGGDGGDISSTLWAGTCHGPGGGGGGGYVGFSASALPATVTITATGGEAGYINSAGAFCDDTPHGAENGTDGGTVFNLGDLVFPEIDLGPDIEVCEGDEYVLDAGDGFSTYEWNTGETTQTITVTEGGEYEVTVTNAYGCAASDSLNIIIFAAAETSLPDELSFCEGEEFVLDAGDGFVSYAWQDGTSTQTYTVNEGGEYSVTVTNSDGCEATVSTTATVFPLPAVDLGNDTALCAGVEAVLDVFHEGAAYAWSTGATTSSITISQPGAYSVIVTSADGCEADDILFVYDPCGGLIVPNAFSPNDDGLNDDFKPVVQSPIGDLYHFEVWNRWGELLFTSEDITAGWDGKYDGTDAELAAYAWVVHYTKENSTIEIIETGWVVLVR